MEGEQFCEEMGQQLNPNSPPLEEEGNLGNGYNDNNYQLVGESETILGAAEHYAIPKEVYLRVLVERNALILAMQQGAAFIQQMQRQHDALIQNMQRQLDALIHGMQEGGAFVQEMQRQHDVLILQMQWQHEVLIQQTHERDALNKEVQERELLHYKIIAGQSMKIANLEDQLKVQINEGDKKCAVSERNVEALETANKSMRKELDECREQCEELKRKLEEENSVHDNLQEGIVNSTQVQQQQVSTGPTFMGEEDNAKNYVDTSPGENDTVCPLSSSNGCKLSSLSASESTELNDFETMQHFCDSGNSGLEAGNQPWSQ